MNILCKHFNHNDSLIKFMCYFLVLLTVTKPTSIWLKYIVLDFNTMYDHITCHVSDILVRVQYSPGQVGGSIWFLPIALKNGKIKKSLVVSAGMAHSEAHLFTLYHTFDHTRKYVDKKGLAAMPGVTSEVNLRNSLHAGDEASKGSTLALKP